MTAPVPPSRQGQLTEVQLRQLTEKAAAGDHQALRDLLERYLPQLRAFIRLRAGAVVRARESHSDIVQSVCRDVLQHADRFRHGSENAFKQWLFKSALRKIINKRDYHLAVKRDVLRDRPMEPSGDGAERASADDAALAACYQSFSTPSQHLQAREEVQRVERAFEELSDEHREVITLAHVVGLSRKEIAEQMGKSEGAVRVLLHRALVKISSLLDEPPA